MTNDLKETRDQIRMKTRSSKPYLGVAENHPSARMVDRDDSSTYPYLVASVFLVLTALSVLLLVCSWPVRPIFSPMLLMILALGLMVCVLFLYIVYARMSGFEGLSLYAHPLFWMYAWLITMFFVPAVYGAWRPRFLEERFLSYSFSQSFTAHGVSMFVVGALIIWIGFDTAARYVRPCRIVEQIGSTLPSWHMLLFTYVLVALMQVFLLLTVGSSYSGNNSALGALEPFIQPFAVFSNISFLIVAYTAFGTFKKRYSPLLLAGILSIQVVLVLASGFRKPIIFLVIVILITALVAKANLRRLLIPAIMLIALAVVVVPMIPFVRQSILVGEPLLPALLNAFQSSWGQGIGHGFAGFTDALLRRQTEVAQMPGVVLEQTPSSHDFKGWIEFFLLPTLLIPRAMWPGKPLVTQGVEFSHAYLGIAPNSTSSSAITFIGEPFMYAGWGTVVAACLLIGASAALIFRLFVQSGMTPLGIALFPTLMDFDSQFSSMMLRLFQDSVVFILVTFVLLLFSGAFSRRGLGSSISAPSPVIHSLK